MPIYEYYCEANHTIYQFFAKTLAQGNTTPKCPDNPKYKLKKVVSAFAITSGGASDEPPLPDAEAPGADPAEDPRMEAAMNAMERDFAGVDENDPKAMARMMRKMSELTGEKIDGEMEEVVRKLEEGADPDSLDEQLGGDESASGDDTAFDAPGLGGPSPAAAPKKEPRHRYKARRAAAPRRDPKLYDYE